MNQWISVLVGLTGLLMFLGTATVFVRSGNQKAQLADLEKSNNLLRAQSEDLRHDVSDRDVRITFLEHQDTLKTAEILSHQHQIEALEKLKTGEAYYQAMHDQVAAHTATVLANHEKILAEQATVRGQLRDILALLSDQRRKS